MSEESTEEHKSKEQQAMESLERMRAYWERASHEENDIEIKRWKAAGKVVLVFIACAVLIYGAKLVQTAYVHVRDQNRLNVTTEQISQLVENIRQAYAAKGIKLEMEPQYLVQSGIVPPSMVDQDGKLRHAFGGEIVIKSSLPKEDGTSTFKLSYQGLSHKICVALAQMDWGTSAQGLQAVALGVADENGYDKALADIDRQVSDAKPKRVQDAKGRWILVQPKPEYLLNVARPDDIFQPTPFLEDDAIAGCACGSKNYCSFALRYAF